ncbi:MAG: hypothetical protein [Bacteriophage sp.]|nr:MAG: hypothetical protein [Bacteriophage sp.]
MLFSVSDNKIAYFPDPTQPVLVGISFGDVQVTATATDLIGTVVSATQTFTSMYSTTPMKMSISVQAGDKFTINYDKATDLVVDWGDGDTATQPGTRKISKTYATAGTYVVSLAYKTPNVSGGIDTSSAAMVTQVLDWGNQSISRFNFSGAINLTAVPTTAPIGLTDASYMFSDCSRFNQSLNDWDVSSVTLFTGMFKNAVFFNGDVTGWVTRSAVSFEQMFYGCRLFNQAIGNWITTNVTNMAYMFYNAIIFNQDIGNWDISSVTTISHMFDGATVFNQALSLWSTVSLIDASYVFNSAIAFNGDVSTWIVDRVITMEGMFKNALAFNQSVANWVTTALTNITAMFMGALVFNQPVNNLNVSKVTSLDDVFNGAKAFNQSVNSWVVTSVVSARRAFMGAINYNQDMANWVTVSFVDVTSMFENAAVFNQPLSTWNVSAIQLFTRMFYNAASFAADISGWYVVSATNMDSMFKNAIMFGVDLRLWCVAQIYTAPANFSTNSGLLDTQLPMWGLCPIRSYSGSPNLLNISGNVAVPATVINQTNFLAGFTGTLSLSRYNFTGTTDINAAMQDTSANAWTTVKSFTVTNGVLDKGAAVSLDSTHASFRLSNTGDLTITAGSVEGDTLFVLDLRTPAIYTPNTPTLANYHYGVIDADAVAAGVFIKRLTFYNRTITPTPADFVISCVGAPQATQFLNLQGGFIVKVDGVALNGGAMMHSADIINAMAPGYRGVGIEYTENAIIHCIGAPTTTNYYSFTGGFQVKLDGHLVKAGATMTQADIKAFFADGSNTSSVKLNTALLYPASAGSTTLTVTPDLQYGLLNHYANSTSDAITWTIEVNGVTLAYRPNSITRNWIESGNYSEYGFSIVNTDQVHINSTDATFKHIRLIPDKVYDVATIMMSFTSNESVSVNPVTGIISFNLLPI